MMSLTFSGTGKARMQEPYSRVKDHGDSAGRAAFNSAADVI